jgi:hypothetical protein
VIAEWIEFVNHSSDDEFANRIEDCYTLIRAAVQSDPNRPGSVEEFEDEYDDLQDFLATRGEFIHTEVQRIRTALTQ